MRFRSTDGLVAAMVALPLLIVSTTAGAESSGAKKPGDPPTVVSYSYGGNCGCIARYAHPSDSPDYRGYWVGGGAAFHGEPRYLDEGTWGWDYFGHRIPRRIALDWWHGERYQGGIGAYKTDGPKLHP